MYEHPVTRRTLLVAAAAGAAGFTASCGSGATGSAPRASSPATISPAASATSPTPHPGPTRARASVSKPPDPARIKANELGVVPVMMYHRLTDDPGEYDMTPKAFRTQIRRLLRSGYRPVQARDLALGQIDIPVGKTPVVLTFDDGSPGQFRLRPDGHLDPTCAAAIMMAECAKVPGAKPRATFYVNKEPFGLRSPEQQRRSLGALLDLGFRLGNHTFDHADLATLSDAGVARQFVRLQQLIGRLAPDADLTTMALPFGVAPRHHRLAKTGSWHGTSYAFALTLLVGANPSHSPFDAAFDPHAVPRIRGTSWHGGRTPLTGTYWLDHLDAHPAQRYVSAGNPDHITVPKRLRSQVARRYRHRIVTY